MQFCFVPTLKAQQKDLLVMRHAHFQMTELTIT